ncbi:MAG: hypothetical protein HQL06_16020 [Nitrospirae bacterium]|nr:hypothetical protein [Nitrospirota bacterium]
MIEIRVTDKEDNSVYELEISGVTTSRQLSSAIVESLSQLYFRLGLTPDTEVGVGSGRGVRGVEMSARVDIQLPFSVSGGYTNDNEQSV